MPRCERMLILIRIYSSLKVIYHATEPEGCLVVITEWKYGLHEMETCLNCQQIRKYFHFLHVTSTLFSPLPLLSLPATSTFRTITRKTRLAT